jgi:hypothetical protein
LSRSAGVTHLEATTLPRLGVTMTVRVEPLPQSFAVMYTGLSNVSWAAVPLPLSLSPFGLTSCWLRVSPDTSDLLLGSSVWPPTRWPCPRALRWRD